MDLILGSANPKLRLHVSTFYTKFARKEFRDTEKKIRSGKKESVGHVNLEECLETVEGPKLSTSSNFPLKQTCKPSHLQEDQNLCLTKLSRSAFTCTVLKEGCTSGSKSSTNNYKM